MADVVEEQLDDAYLVTVVVNPLRNAGRYQGHIVWYL